MKLILRLICFFISLSFLTNAQADTDLSPKLVILKKHYAKYIKNIEGNYLIFANGKKILIDDGLNKSHKQKLQKADIEDMLSQIYPVGLCNDGIRSKDIDPGRIRNDVFFKTVFGNSRKQALSNLVIIDWFGKKLQFTKINRAHTALIKVRDELKQYKNLRKYLSPTAGTFKWRNIAGTKRLSVHSFAAAIDLNIKYANYWRWSLGKSGKIKPYKNKIPTKIIEIFEKHGFIWGGKWHHYDTMHFEYRPELIEIGKKFKTKC